MQRRLRTPQFLSSRVAVPLLTCCAILAATACSPSYRPTLEVPKVTVTLKKDPVIDPGQSAFVFVDQFQDGRADTALASIDGKPMQPEGSVVASVVEALKSALETRGFAFSESAPVMLSGQLRQWHAKVTGSLPTKVAAEAAVFVEILDPSNRRIYSGLYKGFSSMESSSISHLDIQQTLAASLDEALRQIATDKQLVTLLASY